MRKATAPFGAGTAAGLALSALLAVSVLTAAASFSRHLTRPLLPYPDARRLITFEHVGPGLLEPSHPERIPAGVASELTDGGGPWTSLARVKDNQGLTVQGIGPMTGVVASHDLLATIGIAPVLGRSFVEEEDTPGAGYSIIVSHDVWRSHLGADPAVLGRTLEVEHSGIYTVVGVMPEGVRFPVLSNPSFYLPLGNGPGESFLGQPWTTLLARVPTGVGPRDLIPSMARATASWETNRADPAPGPVTIRAVRYTGGFRGFAVAGLLGGIVGIAGLLIIVAGANIGTLTALGVETRARVFAIRRVLGAGTWRVFATLVAGSALPVLTGGVAGLWLAHVALGWAGRMTGPDVRFLIPRVDWASALSALLVLAFLSVVAALVVARRVRATPLNAVLGRSGSGWHGPGSVTLRLAVGGQIAIGGGLLFVGLLFGEAIARHIALDRGYATTHRFVIGLPSGTPLDRALWDQLRVDPALARADVAVGPAPTAPHIENSTGALRAAGGEAMRGRHWLLGVSADYAELLEVPLVAGRFMDSAEVAAATRVAVIDERLARRHWPDRLAVGETLELLQPDGSWAGYRVVGVARGFQLTDARTGLAVGQVMVPFTTARRRAPRLLVHLPDGVSPATVRDLADARVGGQDGSSIISLETLLSRTAGSQILFSRILRASAALGLVTALIGLFGVVAQATQRRRPEFGVRRALGSTKPALARLAVFDAMELTLTSVTVGIVVALGASVGFRPMLLGVSPLDPAAIVLVVATVSGTSILASLGPALLAASVDPLDVMKVDT